MTLSFGSLFAGIGGIDLGLERSGMVCKFQVEIDDYCNRVLAKHWPNVPRHRDVRSVGAHNLPAVDVLAGGFPCQDISDAGKRAGIDGARSGLWAEFARILGELRPRYVLVENVAALLHRGLGRVLGDLAAIGYDAEWECLPAIAVGAPHIRDRVFIVAYAAEGRCDQAQVFRRKHFEDFAKTAGRWWGQGRAVSDDRNVWVVPDAGVFGVADGFPGVVEQAAGLGNAVVPQVAEFIGRQIVAHQEHHHGT